ncbi:hypothetical protein ACWEPC_20550 [Nonomuraea sp. NPDC004297]
MPVRLIGRMVRVMLHASELVVCCGREEAARHGRLKAEGACRLESDHYLEALVRKPGATASSATAGPANLICSSRWAPYCHQIRHHPARPL